MGAASDRATPVSTIPDLLRQQADRRPEQTAILGLGRPHLSYGQLSAHVRETVELLRALGLSRRDRVAVILPNGPDLAVAFLAVASVAACVPLNPAYSEPELRAYFSEIGVTALLVQQDVDSPAQRVAQSRSIPLLELVPRIDAEAGVFTITGAPMRAGVSTAVAGPDDVALILQTSGTTSRPKRVALTHAQLCSTMHSRTTRELVATDRCLIVAPLFYIAGIASLLMALASGTSVVCTPGFDAPRFFEWLAAYRPTWYAAGPATQQAILAHAQTHRDVASRCQLRFIRAGTAPLPPAAKAELEALFGARVDDSYGMTETCGRITCPPPPPAARKPGSVGTSVGPEIAVVDETGTHLPAGWVGEIIVRGPNVIEHYDNDPDADATSFLDGWLRTGDLGYLDVDGHLFLTGRLKEIINRGGEKVPPGEVEAALLDHPSVRDAVAFAVADRRLGEDVAAAVVLRDGATVTEPALRAFLAGRLALFKLPARVVFLAALPRGPTGKLQRIGLAERLGVKARDWPATVAARAYAAPRTPLEELLAAIWARVLGLPLVGIHDELLALGGDSILATQIAAHVRDATGVDVLPTTVLDASTVAELALAITRRQLERGDPEEMEHILAEVERTPLETSPSLAPESPARPGRASG